jgi:hypothetical protein
VFLTLGWMALLGTGYFMVRAAWTFDVRQGVDETAGLGLRYMEKLDLEHEKRHLLKAIKEVEFERDMGKIDPPDAADMIGRYRARALEILRLLDDRGEVRYEEMIEKELASRLAPAPTPAPPAAPAPPAPEPAPAPAQAAAPALATRLPCPKCTILNDHDASFCKKCGTKLSSVVVN